MAKKTYTIAKAQNAFIGGILSGSLYGRVDVEKFSFGMKSCNNFYVQSHGGITNRAGLQFLNLRKYNDKNSVPIPFEFNTEQAYALEFGDYYMRVWKNGGLILAPSATVEVTGYIPPSTEYSPVLCTVSTNAIFSLSGAAAITWTSGDIIKVSTEFTGTVGSDVLTDSSVWEVNTSTNVTLTGVAYDRTVSNATFTKTAHGLTDGALVYASGFAGDASDTLNGKMWQVQTLTADTFRLKFFEGTGFSTGAVTGTAGTGGTITQKTFTLINSVTKLACNTSGKAGSSAFPWGGFVDIDSGVSCTLSATPVFALGYGDATTLSVSDVIEVTNQFQGTVGTDVLPLGSRWTVATIVSRTTHLTVSYTETASDTILTKASHGYSTGDLVFIDGFATPDSGYTTINGRLWVFEKIDANTFYLKDRVTGTRWASGTAGSSAGAHGIMACENFTLTNHDTGVACNTAGKTGGSIGTFTTVLSTSVSAASPAVVTTVNAHGYITGDWVYISGLSGTIGTALNGKFWKVVYISTTTFSITDLSDVAKSTVGLTGGTGGAIGKVYEIATPYSEEEVNNLKITQSADTALLTCLNFKPRVLGRTAHNAWTLSEYVPAPVATPVGAITATLFGGGTATLMSYKICSVKEGSYEESLPSTVSLIGSAWIGQNVGDGYTSYNTLVWTGVPGSARYNVYRSVAGADYTYIMSVAHVVGGEISCRDIVPMTVTSGAARVDPPPPDRALDPFNSEHNYPSCAAYHEQRLWFGGSYNSPQSLWASQIGNYYNMNRKPPVSAEDAVVMTIPSNQVNDIRHMISMRDLLVMTGGGLFVIDSTSGAISAATVRALQHSYVSVDEHVAPVAIGRNVLYVEDRGVGIRDIEFSQEKGGYGGADLTLLARSLFDNNRITSMAYQRLPDSLLYVTLDTGTLLTLTYVKEQDVYAWTTHTTDVGSNTFGSFEKVICIPEGEEDVVYVALKRSFGGQVIRTMEKFHKRNYETINDAVFLDCSLSYDSPVAIDYITTGATTSVTTLTPHGFTVGDFLEWDLSILGRAHWTILQTKVGTVADQYTFQILDGSGNALNSTAYAEFDIKGDLRKQIATVSGLEHLEGETVCVLADGYIDSLATTISGGTYTLVNATRAARIHVGLRYTSTMSTLDGEMAADSQGKIKTSARGVLKFKDTIGGKIGVDAADLIPINQTTGIPLSMQTVYSAEVEQVLHTKWGETTSVTVTQDQPLPMTLLSLVVDTGMGD